MKTKVTERNWPLPKFEAAVKARAKKQGVTAKQADIEKYYKAKYTVPYAVVLLAKAKPGGRSKAA